MLEFMAREQPDVLCLQEIKALADQVPDRCACSPAITRYWHGKRATPGVALLLARAAFPLRPAFRHPEFDHETRIVTAEFAAVRGRVDLRAERRQGLSRQGALSRRARRLAALAAASGER